MKIVGNNPQSEITDKRVDNARKLKENIKIKEKTRSHMQVALVWDKLVRDRHGYGAIRVTRQLRIEE